MKPLSSPRVAVAAIFFINGFCWANWATRIPTVQGQLGLNSGELGLGLSGGAIGAISALPLSSWLLARYGSETVTRLASFAFCAAIVLPTQAANLPLLFVSLMLAAGSSGVMDVAMNTQAAAIEAGYRRPIMSSFHGLFSLGTMAGAAVGGLIAAQNVAPLPHLLSIAVASLVAIMVATRHLLPVQVAAAGRGPVFVRPTRAILGLGIVACCAVLGEGAMVDWSAVYLSRNLAADVGLAATGYAVFSATMAAMRFGGDALTLRFGPVKMVRGGGLIAAGGLAFGLLGGQIWTALVGFACVGLGLASIFPIAMSAASRIPNLAPGLAISMTATAGYGGFLVGPALIGFVAQAFSLPLALGCIVVSSTLMALLAPVVGQAAALQQAIAPQAMAVEEIAG